MAVKQESEGYLAFHRTTIFGGYFIVEYPNKELKAVNTSEDPNRGRHKFMAFLLRENPISRAISKLGHPR